MHECTSIPSILRHVRHMAHGHLQCTRQSHFHIIYSPPHLYKAINAAGAIPAMPTAQCRCGVYRNVITTNATSDGATALTLQMTRSEAQWITVHRMTTYRTPYFLQFLYLIIKDQRSSKPFPHKNAKKITSQSQSSEPPKPNNSVSSSMIHSKS